jgi:predicted DNA-binding transcriptional regulator YafY
VPTRSGRPNPHLAVARVERHQRIIEALAAKAPRRTGAGELAQTVEVSTRTIERDVAELIEAGVPVDVRRGPGGGYALATRGRIVISLGSDEVAVLVASLVGLGPYATSTARTTLRKLLEASHRPPTSHDRL